VYKDGEGKEEGKALPGSGHGRTDEKDHKGGGEDVAEEEAKEEGFGVGLIDFRGRGGTGPNGRGICDDEQEGVERHDDAHGGELEEDADGGGHVEGGRMAVAGSFEEGDQRSDTDGGEEHGKEGVVGWVNEGVEEGDHATEEFVGVGYICVCDAISMRGNAGVAYGGHFELEASLDEGLVEDEIHGDKGEKGKDEEGKYNIWWMVRRVVKTRRGIRVSSFMGFVESFPPQIMWMACTVIPRRDSL
jgi:hypothetical protein